MQETQIVQPVYGTLSSDWILQLFYLHSIFTTDKALVVSSFTHFNSLLFVNATIC